VLTSFEFVNTLLGMKEQPATRQTAFEKAFANHMARMEKMNIGQQVEAVIISITPEFIFLDLGGKSEGVLERAELADEAGLLCVEEGDTLKAWFMGEKNGEMHFTTRLSGQKAGPELLESAWKSGIPVEGVVDKEIKGGYEVKIGESRAFCPYSQMGRRAEDTGACVGTHLRFKIVEYKDGGRSITVSNRAILEAERADKMAELRSSLREGQTITGTVVQIQDFGAFVDIGGVQALLPVSEVSRDRVKDMHSVLERGQTITAQILKLDWNNERFSISMKALASDPWQTVAERYPAGSRHTGTVTRIAGFGAFVSLESGIEGLVHTSELNSFSGTGGQKNGVKVGQKLAVRIIAVDQENRRISLQPATTEEEDETARRYLDSGTDSDTYNPFAALLKKK